MSSGFFLEFEALQSEPPLEKIFLETGGPIDAAAARGETEFAVTGSTTSVVRKLSDSFSTSVRIEIPKDQMQLHSDKPMTLEMDARAKLILSTSREGCSINGSLVTTVAGEHVCYLSKVLRTASPTAVLPLKYASWAAHTAVVSASDFRVVDEEGHHYDVHFKADEKRDEALAAAEKIMAGYSEGAWNLRQNVLVYQHSPSLTKTVYKTPSGINDCGFNFVHDILDPTSSPYSYMTINSLFKQSVSTYLEFLEPEIESFLSSATTPSLAASENARTVAASLSIMSAFLVNYRADGRTSVLPTGSKSVAAESWLPHRSSLAGDDCDGSAISSISIVQACLNAPNEVREQYPFINAVYNSVFPHYTIGISVLGASSAEASAGGSDGGKAHGMAGHATAMMVPTMSLLKALDRGGTRTVAGQPVLGKDQHAKITEARFKAMYTPEVVGAMPEEEREAFATWEGAQEMDKKLPREAFAPEGTTPASPILFATGTAAVNAANTAENDGKVFSKVGPTVGRSIKILYAGGANTASPHRFYHDLVEYSMPKSSPLWNDPAVRELGAAFTQIALTKHVDNHAPLEASGVTPRELVSQTYAAIPLVVVDAPTGRVLDFASQTAQADVMPPRPQKECVLTEFKSAQLNKSLAALKQLDDAMTGRDPGNGHAVAYVLAYSTLVNNPVAVQHLCSRLKEVSVAGMVDSLEIDGMMQTHSGKEAGKMIVINSVVPI